VNRYILRDREQRLEQANALIEAIANCGRRFFHYPEQHGISRITMDERGRLWFVDGYTGKRIYLHFYLHYRYWRRGFSEGGTLRAVMIRLEDYIMEGTLLPRSIFGPWPESLCGGDLWGYGEDMQIVREKAQELGIVKAGGEA